MKKYFFILFLLSFAFFFSTKSFAHCQIPCGIYDDKMRFTMMAEHVTTIEKSMNQMEKK